MSNEPLDYAAPQRPPSHNTWWMVMLRIFAGLAAGVASGALGAWLGGVTGFMPLFFVPPGLVFAGLLVVCIKYRRFGYLTGFVMAPFLVATAAFILLLIICGHHP